MTILTDFFTQLAGFIISLISSSGYAGVFVLMAAESAFLPVPSEIVLPFAGFLVAAGAFDFWLATLAATLGCVAGSAASYWVGLRGGRPLLERYGKYILIRKKELDWADALFAKHGNKITLISRFLPVIRTAISLPAGIARMPFKTFIFYAFIGSLPWCAALIYAGVALGQNWNTLGTTFHNLDLFIIAGVIIIAAIVLYKLRKK